MFLKTLRDRRRSLLGWSIGLGVYALYSTFLYPAIKQSAEELRRFTETIPEEFQALTGGELDLATGAGYLQGQLFSFMVPLLLLVFCIGFGARTVAGEERDGPLELVLAAPQWRRTVVAQKLAALLVGASLLGLVLWGALVVGGWIGGIGVGAGRLAAAVLVAVLLALTFGTLALLVGCATGRRGLAVSVATIAAVVTYLLDGFSALVEALEPTRLASPWHYYASDEVLRTGLEPGNLLLLFALVTVFSAGSILAFDRRDVGV